MDLVIFNDSYPPDKQFWSTPNISDRGNWSWICELIGTWFCFSNGIRKENNVFVVINDIEIELRGEEIRYLAPSQRSIFSILSNAYRRYRSKSRRYQPGIYVRKFEGMTKFEEPKAMFCLDNNEKLKRHKIEQKVKTLLIGGNLTDINKLHVFAESYNQALIWLIYG